MGAGQVIGGLVGLAGALDIGGNRQRRKQVEQQTKLNAVNAKTAKELADYENEGKLKMWKDTNYSAMLGEAERAGVSKAHALGGSMGGTQGASVSSVGGGSADGASASMSANSGKMMAGMQMAQLALLNAQKDNIEADTANKQAGTGKDVATTTKTGEETKALQWENEVRKVVGSDTEGTARNKEAQLRDIEATKESANIKAYLRGAFDGKASDDENSPLAKSIRAGLDKTVTDLENAKKQGKIMDATKAIEEFKANLAKQGIAPDSPWFVKILTTLLKEKFNIDLGTVGNVVKGAIK